MSKYVFIIVYVCIFVDLEYASVLFMLWILVWHKCVTWRWQGAVLLLFVAHFRCHQILTVLTDCRCRFMQKTKLTQIDACRCFELPFVCPILKVCPILNSGLLELMHKGQKIPYFGIIALVRLDLAWPSIQNVWVKQSEVKSILKFCFNSDHTAKLRISWFLVPQQISVCIV